MGGHPIVEITTDDMKETSSSYYDNGNSEIAQETALTEQRLEARRRLTKTASRTVIALVGLPARGKSFVARKLLTYLNWTGVHCKIFNVGKYRRQEHASQFDNAKTQREKQGACDANFFDPNNAAAKQTRELAAQRAMADMLQWLDWCEPSESSSDEESHCKLVYKSIERVAIFDATNSTQERRQWIVDSCTGPDREYPISVVFVESICDDQELLEENYLYKVSSSPDFAGIDAKDALQDLRDRVAKYESAYETIQDNSMSYIKIYDLSTKLMVNHIYGRMAKEVVPALMAWHIGTRPIYLCRPGQTVSGIFTDAEDYVNRTTIDLNNFKNGRDLHRSCRGDTLGPNGRKFSRELLEFCTRETQQFRDRRASVRDLCSFAGTSAGNEFMKEPLRIYTSTMPRAYETVAWDGYEVNQKSNLNPLDKGDFAGEDLEQLKKTNPDWYEKLERDPYTTRFPGGESYCDLMSRLTSILIDLEQEVVPTLLVSHVSILQCLMAYFRNTRVERCMSIEVPLHTVVKFTPVRGGGWRESHHPFYEFTQSKLEKSMSEFTAITSECSALSMNTMGSLNTMGSDSSPIWVDHGMPTPPQNAREIVQVQDLFKH